MNSYTISLAALAPLLFRRKWLILFGAIVGAITAVGAVRILPHGFTSQGAIIINDVRASSADGANNGPAAQEDILRTQKDVLQSRGLIERVVRMLNLQHSTDLAPAVRWPVWLKRDTSALADQIRSLVRMIDGGSEAGDPDDAALNSGIEYIQKSLRLTSADQSSVVLLEFTAGTPHLATSVLSSIMKTYLADRETAKMHLASETSRLLSQRAAEMNVKAEEAQQKLEAFLRQRPLPEVQGSLAASVLLSRNQEQLATARSELAKLQAKVDILNHFGANSLAEVLASRTIQRYRDRESELVGKLALYGQSDSRRMPLSNALSSVRAEIERETGKIAASIKDNAAIAGATVKQLEAAVAKDVSTSQESSVVGSTLAALRSDVDAKQQMFVAFEKSAAEQQRLEMSQPPLARILYPASVVPSRHFGLAALILGFLVGSLASSAVVILRKVFYATIRSPLDLAIAADFPVLGSLPEIKGRLRSRAITQQVTSETLRALCVTLRPEIRDKGEAVLITSCEGGEGKTTLAATMAKTYAGDGFRVLLIDGDLRRPKLASIIGIRPRQTIEAVLAGTVPWTEAVVRCSDSGLHCLLASGKSSNPISAINSPHLSALIEASRRLYDFIILDGPPVLRVADPLILAQRCQHVLFVVRAGFLSPDLVNQAIHRFPPSERNKTKMMLVRVDPAELDKGDYYGGYGLPRLEAS